MTRHDTYGFRAGIGLAYGSEMFFDWSALPNSL